MAAGLTPGNYFRFVSEAVHTSRVNNGVISEDGVISGTTSLEPGLSYSIFYWKPGTEGILQGRLFIDNDGNPSLRGIVYTIQNTSTTDRIYKVESIGYAEDGLVEITGTFTPIRSGGTGLAVMDDRGFDVDFA